MEEKALPSDIETYAKLPTDYTGYREGCWASLLTWAVGSILVHAGLVDWLPAFAAYFLVFVLGLAVGGGLVFWIGGSYRRQQEKIEQSIIDERMAEQERQLAEAKARGDFDRWDKPNV